MIGDLNNNGMIETGDVLMLLRHLSNESTKKHSDWELKGNSLKKADIVENNIINQPDVLALLRYIAAKSSSKVASKHPDWLSLIDQRNSVIVPTDITLDKATMSLMVGQKDKLTATVVPENAEDKRVYWKSSNEKVAEVDAFGNIKAVAEGECTVNATTWNGKTKACIVKITKFVAENGNTANNTNSTSTGSQPPVTGGGSGGGGGGYGDPGSSNPGTGNPGGSEQGGSEDGEEVELEGFEVKLKDTLYTFETGKVEVTPKPEGAKIGAVHITNGDKMLTINNEDRTYTATEKNGITSIKVSVDDSSGNHFQDYAIVKSIVVKKCIVDSVDMLVDSVDMPQKIELVYKDENDSGGSGGALNKTNITAELITNQLGAKPEYITDKTLIWQKQVNTGTKIDMDTNSTDGITATKTITALEPGMTAVFARSNDGPIGMTHVFVRGIKVKQKDLYLTMTESRINLYDYLIAFDTENSTKLNFTYNITKDWVKHDDDGNIWTDFWKEMPGSCGTITVTTPDGNYTETLNLSFKVL